MTVRLLYFAWVRERIGIEEEQIFLDEPISLAELLDRLSRISKAHADIFSDCARLRAAVNHEFSNWSTIVHPGDEIAIFPPVTGGY